ncbi:hypothetical protein AC579_7288 [Pseudocercospora musae]|uniref:Uncharacterized protein n=1 Tax=Pseudocercospora musae TaxID=113226 RepID=A0A139I370_9PEZI|nr:hypothetical protein AC579_7288 [Pseudocercospora musae]KXT09170.1 hypothetical protein AC579_7288 [Pseudocercospora musae]
MSKDTTQVSVDIDGNVSHRLGSGHRRATAWKPVTRPDTSRPGYPKNSTGLSGSLHDVRYYQAVLDNLSNFAKVCSCDIFESIKQSSQWLKYVDKDSIAKCLKSNDNSNNGSFRAIFCTLERAPETSFGCRVSLDAASTALLLESLSISPQFLPMLLGEPEYWAPGDFASYNLQGDQQCLEFFCQQPRWNLHKKDVPLSIYMTHDLTTKATTYVISCSKEQAQLKVIQERLEDAFRAATVTEAADPFMLHALVTHEVFAEARSVVTPVRYQLYDQLDRVDKYAERSAKGIEPSPTNTSLAKSNLAVEQDEPENLQDITIQLNVVSQEVDSMTANADMASMIVHRLIEAHDRYRESVTSVSMRNAVTKTHDSLQYLAQSIDAQKRWLQSYKVRKDTAMNLVYNLVMQQNSTTSTTIALETRADGASMKVIAALTMLFLPGTFLSSVFGMSMLNNAKWWLYVALTLPLTIIVIATWWLWFEFPTVVAVLKQWIDTFRWKKRGTKQKKNNIHPEV